MMDDVNKKLKIRVVLKEVDFNPLMHNVRKWSILQMLQDF